MGAVKSSLVHQAIVRPRRMMQFLRANGLFRSSFLHSECVGVWNATASPFLIAHYPRSRTTFTESATWTSLHHLDPRTNVDQSVAVGWR